MYNKRQGRFHRTTQAGGQEGERHQGACSRHPQGHDQMTHRRRPRTGPRDDHPWRLPDPGRTHTNLVTTASGAASR